MRTIDIGALLPWGFSRGRCYTTIIYAICLMFILLWGVGACTIGNPTSIAPVVEQSFDGERAYQYVLAQCDLGPRPAGSAANRATVDYIVRQLIAAGWDVHIQAFEHLGVPLQNVIGKRGNGNRIILLGAHFDTRPVADQDPDHPARPVLGCNDGASGVAVLLELAHVLREKELSDQIWLAFFDGEDRGGLDNWDWSVGASYMASNLRSRPDAVIIVDMIGDSDQQIYMEENSDRALLQEIWQVAAELKIDTFIAEMKWRMLDDHLPFIQRDIPAALLIDFDYPYWHTTHDTADKVSPESLQNVGRVLEYWLER